MWGQLLDNTQVSGDVDTGTEVDPIEEDAEGFASPTKARRQGDFNGPHSKSHKKPLPATYEPGTLPPPAVTNVYTAYYFFRVQTFTHRQADLCLAQTQERLRRWRRG